MLPCKWDLSDLWKTVGAISELLADHPVARTFFGVIDVAGDEQELANWVFTVALSELERRLKQSGLVNANGSCLIYTYHAGESFDTPLQGLRRIDAVLTHAPFVTRLNQSRSGTRRTAAVASR